MRPFVTSYMCFAYCVWFDLLLYLYLYLRKWVILGDTDLLSRMPDRQVGARWRIGGG